MDVTKWLIVMAVMVLVGAGGMYLINKFNNRGH
jgi:hypothetical protein